MAFTIRIAGPEDADTLRTLIIELADYENLLHEAKPDAAALRQHLQEDAAPRLHALLAEVDGEAAGMAIFFFNYSTFLTRWGIYLEDLVVRPTYRGQGIGYGLLKRLAAHAHERGCERLDWSVLDWNEPAIDFYHKLGARHMKEWNTMRLEGTALRTLGTSE